jgi:hypothetical protein
MVHFRSLFVELLGRDEHADAEPRRDDGAPPASDNQNVREMR